MLLLGFTLAIVPTATCYAGSTLTAGGFVIDDVDTTNADGGTWSVYKPLDSSIIAYGQTGEYESRYWAGEIGAYLENLDIGNELICFIEKEVNPDPSNHKGYYAVMNHYLTNNDPAEFSDCTLRQIPSPSINKMDNDLIINWLEAVDDSEASSIVGYNLFRSSESGIFEKINNTTLTQTNFTDYDLSPGDYVYAISLVYRGSPTVEGIVRSANSQPIIFCLKDFDGDQDVDGSDLHLYIINPSGIATDDFSKSFGKINCSN